MHNTPLWYSIWQSVDGLLGMAADATVVLPLMCFICLMLGRHRQRAAFFQCARLCFLLAATGAIFGLADIILRGVIDIILLPAALPGLKPIPFEPLAPAWLSTTTTTGLWAAGMLLVFLAAKTADPAIDTVSFRVDFRTSQNMHSRVIAASCISLAATLLFFASLITRYWPFMGLPEQMTQERVFTILLSNAWRSSWADFMPAGALAVLAFFLLRTPVRELCAAGATDSAADKNSAPADQKNRLPEDPAAVLRLCCAFAIAGAAFHFLNASFVAFSAAASMGIGLRSTLMQFGPFMTTALSLSCWIFLFAKPRRDALFFALLPVLFLLLRAVLRF